MSTITLEIPDDLLSVLETRAEAAGEDRLRFAVAALARGLEEDEEDLSSIPASVMFPDPDALRRAQESLDAGKGIDGETFLAKLRAAARA